MNHEQDFKIKAEWIFTATAHGKSACDGIGGTFKRMARSESLKRQENPITNPRELFEFGKQSSKTMFFDFVSKEEQEREAKKQKYNNLKTIKGTQQFHHFVPDGNTLKCFKFSTSPNYETRSVKYVKKSK